MNIAVMTMYGDYYNNDRLFDPSTCLLGQNLLQPVIELKNYLEKKGHNYHTYDMYRVDEIDKLVCFGIPGNSIRFIESLKEILFYLYGKNWKYDYFNRIAKRVPVENRILVLQEPPVVDKKSYNKKYHDLFGKIMTWNSELVDNKKYFKFFCPQPVPEKTYSRDFDKKKLFTQICSNKTGVGPDELYTERKKVIEYFEGCLIEFDLYGAGWDNCGLKNYKGRIDDKLNVLSNYKFSFAYENCKGVKGGISEKIFDCFFAGVIPIYLGADDIDLFVPKECFIDRRLFSSTDQVVEYCENMSRDEYETFRRAASDFVNYGRVFKDCFSIESYVECMGNAFIG